MLVVHIGTMLFIPAHPPPFGPIGLAFFIVAVLLFARSQAETNTLTAQPTSA